MNKKLVAVYGSLLSGLGNNVILKDSKQVSTETVDISLNMYDLGMFPALMQSDTINKINIEVYEVDDAVYKRIERLEGYPHFYDRLTIHTSVGYADIYYINKPSSFDMRLLVSKNKNNEISWKDHLASREKQPYYV